VRPTLRLSDSALRYREVAEGVTPRGYASGKGRQRRLALKEMGNAIENQRRH
jgi:hypothetical protein